MDNIVKIGSVKLTESEARRYYFDEKKRYIIVYRRVYAVCFLNHVNEKLGTDVVIIKE